MTDHVVHRCADRLGETAVSEGGRVGVVLDRLLVHNEVYFIRCHANLEATRVTSVVHLLFFYQDKQTHTILSAVIRRLPSDCVRPVTARVWQADTLG